MNLERSAVVSALNKYDGNVSHAAEELGSSRRTLQLRMKIYGIPQGHAGRPREPLPYVNVDNGIVVAIGALAVGAIAWGWWQSRQHGDAVLGGDIGKTEDLRGLDVILRR